MNNKIINIYYKIKPEKNNKRDIGIFESKLNTFKGKQYSIFDEKLNNRFKYQKEFYKISQSNKMFKNKLIDLEDCVETFFLRTTNKLNTESLGDLFTLVDILEKVKFKNNLKIRCFIPNESSKLIFNQFFRKNKIKDYKIIIKEKKTKKFIYKIIIENLHKVYFIRILLKYFFGLINKTKQKSNIAFLTPIENPKIHSKVENHFLKKKIKFDNILFESKNSFFKNFNKPKYYFKLLKKVKKTEKKYIGSFFNKKNIIKIIKTYKKLKKTSDNIRNKQIKYKDYSLQKAILEFLKLYENLILLTISENLILVEEILNKYKTIIYSDNDDPLLKIINKLNKNDRNELISLQYELIYPGCAYYFYNKKQHDKKYVWNKYSKEVLVSNYKFPKDKVDIIGNIRFNKITKIKHKKIKIVLTSQDAHPRVIDFFLKAIKSANNEAIEYFIKPHPADNKKSIQNKIYKYKLLKKVKIIKEDINKTLSFADLIISFYSTTLFEAIYNNIPIAIIELNKKFIGVPLKENYPSFKTEKKLSEFFNKINKEKLETIKVKTKDNPFSIVEIKKELIKTIIKKTQNKN